MGINTVDEYEAKLKLYRDEVKEHETKVCKEYVYAHTVVAAVNVYPDASGPLRLLKKG